MVQNTNNHTVRNFFDEESDDEECNETFLSPASDTNQNLDFTTLARQPLASSSRQSSVGNPKNVKTPKPKSKKKNISNIKSKLLQNKEKSKLQTENTLLNNEKEYLPRRKSQQNTDNGTETKSKRKINKPRKMVMQDIQKYQNSTDRLIPKLPFSKVIREILLNPNISKKGDLRITPTALEALQESAEIYLTIFFEDAYRCTIHRGRTTLIVKDMELVRVLRGVDDPGYRAL